MTIRTFRSRPAAPPPALTDRAGGESVATLRELSAGTPDEALARLGSGWDGLTDAEAAARLTAAGLNELPRPRPPALPRRLWAALRSPFAALLAVLAVLVAATGEPVGAALITVMLALAVGLRLYQERRFGHLLGALGRLAAARVGVVRRPGRGGSRRVTSAGRRNPRLLVPGDLLLVGAGDVVPADCRVLAATDLTVDQATLTGESAPVPKHPTPPGTSTPGDGTAGVLAAPTLCLTGTTVLTGQATLLVVRTGAHTLLGGIARHATRRRPPTAAELGLRRVTWLLVRALGLVAPVVFALALPDHHGRGWPVAAMFTVAAAVGLVPEMLPVILAIAQARGMAALARHRVVLTRPDAVQDLAAMDVLCVDKTGTLTTGRPRLTATFGTDGEPCPEALDHAVLHAAFGTDRHPLTGAVLDHAGDLDTELARARYRLAARLPHDHARRRSSTVLAAEPGGELLMVTLGAVSEVLAACATVRTGGRELPFTPERRAAATRACRRAWAGGSRLLAVAGTVLPAPGAAGDGSGLTLVGFLAFTDSVRPDAAVTVAALTARGVRTVLVTGDAAAVAVAVAGEVGLPADRAVTGAEVAAMDDARLAVVAPRTSVFAEVDPAQKARVVGALRTAGHTVGMLADGVNDTAALHGADIGIGAAGAVGVARTAADAVLLTDRLPVLAEAVTLARQATLNATKYLKATLVANLGNTLSVLAAGLLLPFLPLLPVQLVAQNLCYDLAQLALPYDRTDPDQLNRPHRWNIPDLIRFTCCLAPVGTATDLATFALLAGPFHALAHPELFRAGWLLENLLTQILAVHVLRTDRLPTPRRRASRAVLATTLVALAATLTLVASPVAGVLGLRPPPAALLALTAGLLVPLYLVALSAAKAAYRRTTGHWL